ncbi:putative short-chain collagen C4-like [Apostichopus japonicus]|uniref:Putative short-chain collagen C4-like n=1 Tax=Stichopus japonicus TaxID=307972 RepID=A0A2G8KJB6_STIJA|nr:putative short-chain collagen C4-like [Apostichopus japonicus]
MYCFSLLLTLVASQLPFVSAASISTESGDTDGAVSVDISDALMKRISHLEAKLKKIETELEKNEVKDRLSSNKGDAIEDSVRNVRDRRDAGDGLQQLPGQTDGIPGINGCPVTVTPFSIGGSACLFCPSGPRGDPGPSGQPGRDGRDALAIITPGFQEMTSSQTTHFADNPSHHSNTSGAVYVRWGHKECPTSSLLVYSGIAAGAFRGETGNGANQLCLPSDPVYSEPVAGVGASRSFLYAIEYQIDNFPTLSDRSWHDVPCAVCKAPTRFAQLMIPGKNLCPSNEWTLEYRGYLMAERAHSVHQRSMYICVDQEMQTIDRTHGSATGALHALLDLVEGRCVSSGGGLPCGPYVDGYELTCAVCTQ